MFDPRFIHRTAIALISLLGSLAAIAALVGPPSGYWQNTFGSSIEINGFVAATIVFVSLFVPFYILNRRLFEISAKHHNVKQLLAVADDALRDAAKIRHTDVVTGIPNQTKWQIDISETSKNVSETNQFHQILIDLDGFREINTRYGYAKGDQVLSYFAQNIYAGMRRNEEMYKQPYDEPIADHEFWKRVYRKYSGGDEFLFLIAGPEVEAIGFLVRLQRLINDNMNRHISQNILNEPYELRFHGAVCPLYRDDDSNSAFTRIQDGLRVAAQRGRTSRVFWFSRKTAADFEPGNWMHRLYSDAENVFKIQN